MYKIAINGFGRIGRMSLRSIIERKLPLKVEAINDLADTKTLAHLFKYDSTFGVFNGSVSYDENSLIINGEKIRVFSERDPLNIPWGENNIDLVLECTGFFCKKEDAKKHIISGSKYVVISAPAKDEVDGTFVIGVNDNDLDPNKHFIVSNASCTTNCLAPVVKALNDELVIKKGIMTTIHSYTGDQRILDAAHSDPRRSRSAAVSMIPTSTGAAKAVSLVIPELKGKLNGLAIRVPTPNVSIVDVTVEVGNEVSKEDVNNILKKYSEDKMKGVLGYEDSPLVSIDFKGDSRSSIVDGQSTMVIGNMVKVLSWYDNEWGYACRLCDLAEKLLSR